MLLLGKTKTLVMLQQQDFIVTTEEEFQQIESVKSHIEEMHHRGSFFHLSLKALELIRRFNNLYVEVFERHNESSSMVNQLLVTAKILEAEFVQEI